MSAFVGFFSCAVYLLFLADWLVFPVARVGDAFGLTTISVPARTWLCEASRAATVSTEAFVDTRTSGVVKAESDDCA